MPLPSKNKGESRPDFVSRCMGDSVMNKEFPDEKQRASVCYSQYKKVKKTKASSTPQWEDVSDKFFTVY